MPYLVKSLLEISTDTINEKRKYLFKHKHLVLVLIDICLPITNIAVSATSSRNWWSSNLYRNQFKPEIDFLAYIKIRINFDIYCIFRDFGKRIDR